MDQEPLPEDPLQLAEEVSPDTTCIGESCCCVIPDSPLTCQAAPGRRQLVCSNLCFDSGCLPDVQVNRRLPSGSSGLHALEDQARLQRAEQHQLGTARILLYGVSFSAMECPCPLAHRAKLPPVAFKLSCTLKQVQMS